MGAVEVALGPRCERKLAHRRVREVKGADRVAANRAAIAPHHVDGTRVRRPVHVDATAQVLQRVRHAIDAYPAVVVGLAADAEDDPVLTIGREYARLLLQILQNEGGGRAWVALRKASAGAGQRKGGSYRGDPVRSAHLAVDRQS